MLTHLTHATRSTSAKSLTRAWHIVDARAQVLGKVATRVSRLLQGKIKVAYVDYLDTGDYVVVINAKEAVVTGRKAIQKIYTNYSGYPGGLRKEAFAHAFDRKPAEVIRRAISGMLPKNKLRDRRLARLHVYAEDVHPYMKKFA